MARNTLFASMGTALVFAVTLAACGGGGGGSYGGPGPNPSPSVGASPSATPSTSPSPTPSSTSAHPAADGDTFAFTGTRSQTIQRFRPTPTPPTQVLNASVTQNDTVHTGRTFHATAATDFQATEVDTGTNQALTVNSDNYVQVPASTGNLISLGFHSVDSNGATVDQNLIGQNVILDMIPETMGALWNNNAAETLVATDPDGTSITLNTNANGSYTESIADPVIGTTTATQNSDGSGTLDSPSIAFFGTGTGTHIAISAVSANTINLTVSSVGAPPPSPAPVVFNLTAWYPQSPTLASDQFTDMGTSAMPASCDAAAFGATGVHLHEVKTRLDTVFGAQENETVDTWVVPGFGPACIQTSDVTKQYYDFTGQSFFFNDIIASTPAQTTTLAEMIGLQAATIHASARHPASSARLASQSAALRFAFVQDRFERQRAVLRLRQAHGLRSFLTKRGIRL